MSKNSFEWDWNILYNIFLIKICYFIWLRYLNLSNNHITDEGLKYLNELKNINELVLFNMDKLSDDYFLYLQTNYFVNKMKNFTCDKNKLTLKSINDNYNDFNLTNLVSIKIIDDSTKIHLTLRKLFGLDKIYFILIILFK